jgi:hypothetical protein
VPARNRVTPTGEIVAVDQRGMFMGNRGCIHRRPREIARPWQVRRWITCALEFKGWVAPRWEPGRWTPLFFWDEAVALAAGHRPCALCRRADYNRWLAAWQAAFGGDRPRADPMDRRLHGDRLDGRAQRRHRRSWADLPAGAFVDTAGPALVLPDRLVPWSGRSSAGYGAPVERPRRGDALVLTPRATVEVLRHGYRPVVHPSAGAAS